MRTRDLFALIVLCLTLAACGQKGDLVRPEPEPKAAAAQ
ncbi:MAG: lipoprotein [Rhodanobacteraceae bacterium]|nr:lipoprotein [Rhodanobacteraceae bacterium]MBL0041549.1 lipoprotein [Xanthomonadales bacterium]MBP6078009.1 lipoprotein [Xanthomonadales bacterium]MBP7624484.1 lipoprotein [Xanthomonadales bacterium]